MRWSSRKDGRPSSPRPTAGAASDCPWCVASPNAQLSANNLCSESPCTTSGNPYARETFSFISPAHAGVFRWQCLVPCGGGFLDGNSGPMQSLGYMMGEMDVVSS